MSGCICDSIIGCRDSCAVCDPFDGIEASAPCPAIDRRAAE